MTTVSLSKSRFQYGLQCLKRLYLETYHRELADPVDPGQQAIFDTGTAVGEMARERFPGGRLIEETYLEHDQSVESTLRLLSGTVVPAIYEAGFTYQGIKTRVDILRRRDSGDFDLIEVKSSTRVKPENYTDVAIQLYAVEGSGVPVRGAFLMHLNRDYVYQGGEHNLLELFALQDVTDTARSFVENVAQGSLVEMWSALGQEEGPDIQVGRHCTRPYRCSFYDYCHHDLNIDYGKDSVSPGLGSALEEIRFPAAFLDFETINPAIPVYPGTKPYQVIPFQWSLHIVDSTGKHEHRWFLNDDGLDPRERLALSLLEAVPPEGSIVTYSQYERTVINGLAQALPHYADRLLSLCERMVDLLKVVRGNIRHPGFRNSYSLKSVLPVLAPGMGYADLEIAEGMTATKSYSRMVGDDTPADEKAGIREALLAYCARDTEAMVRVYEALLDKAGTG